MTADSPAADAANLAADVACTEWERALMSVRAGVANGTYSQDTLDVMLDVLARDTTVRRSDRETLRDSFSPIRA